MIHGHLAVDEVAFAHIRADFACIRGCAFSSYHVAAALWFELGLCGRFPVPGECRYWRRVDLRQKDLALLREHAPMIPEVVDHQSVPAEQGKEPFPVVAHNSERRGEI